MQNDEVSCAVKMSTLCVEEQACQNKFDMNIEIYVELNIEINIEMNVEIDIAINIEMNDWMLLDEKQHRLANDYVLGQWGLNL